MDKYEYRIKTEQMLKYAEEKSYRKAMEIADTIDWRKVKNSFHQRQRHSVHHSRFGNLPEL